MALFKKIADKFRNVLVKADKETVNSRATATEIIQLAETTLRYLKQKDLKARFINGLEIKERGKKHYLSGAVYERYFRKAGMNVEHMERKSPLSSWIKVLETICSDLGHIERNIDYAAISDKEAIGLSSLAVDGYFYGAQEFCMWVFYLLATAEAYRPDGKKVVAKTMQATDANTRASTYAYPDFPVGAPYMAHKAIEITPAAIDFARTLLSRRGKDDFVSMIKKMQTEGRDVAIKTANHLIDTYANEHDYNRDELHFVELGFRSPIAALGTHRLLKSKEVYDRNKATREWLAANVARFSLNAAQSPEDSAEQKKFNRLAQAYLDLVSEYDKKLKAFHEDEI